MDKAKVKKIGSVALNVLLYIFLAICIFMVFITIASKKDSDGAAEIFGYQIRVVTSDSMAKCEYTDVSSYKIKDIPVRSLIFVKVMPDGEDKADEWYRSLKVGDVLTFRYVYTTQVTITHRVVSVNEKSTGGFVIELAGDNKSSENGQLNQVIDTSVPNNTNYVIGKVTGQSYLLGVIMSLLMSTQGIILIIIVPCVVIVFIEIIKIVKTLGADKKKLRQEEELRKDNELEELRRKLAELEGSGKAPDTVQTQVEKTESNASSKEEETK